jgi:PIN domain nuclease of toxin-antitoxin system
LLLDTHALLWWMAGDDRMRQRDLVDNDDNEVFASAVSAYEIALKHRLGKLPGAARLAGAFEAEIARQDFSELSLTVAHARLAGQLAGEHRDPFDRMLAAQAIVENLVLISNDAALDQFGVQRLW